MTTTKKTTRPAPVRSIAEPIIRNKPSPLKAVEHVERAIEEMERWMEAMRGKNVPMVVYRNRTNSLAQFCKVIRDRREQIERL